MIDDYAISSIKRIIYDIVDEKANNFYNNVQNGINDFAIYEQIEKVMKQRADEIIEREYKNKINDVVNEIMDKLKERK